MGATLLLADDSITIQRVIELTFADEDIRVIVASDGHQAIQKIDAERPDIVLADVGMPRLDGYAVAAHIKQSASLKHIPVLLLTGAFEPIDEARARQSGSDGVLVKPFEPQKLIAQVKELLNGTRPVVQAPAPESVRSVPELLKQEQFEVATPPLSVPAADTAIDIDPVIDPVFDLRDADLAAAAPAASVEGDDVPNRNGEHVPRHARPELPPPADHFESELDMLDAALSRLDPTAHPHELDAETASEFARDLNDLRNETRGDDNSPRPARPSFGDWDLPKPSNGEVTERQPIDVLAEEIPLRAQPVPPVVEEAAPVAPPPAPAVQAPPPVVAAPTAIVHIVPPVAPIPAPVAPAPPAAPVQVTPQAPPPAATPAPAPLPAAPIERPTLSTAFSALLAAEKSRPAAHAVAPQISEAAIEEVVKRVLARMAGDTVNRVVLETAERLIREEISRTKDPSGR